MSSRLAGMRAQGGSHPQHAPLEHRLTLAARGRPCLFLTTVFGFDMWRVLQQLPWMPWQPRRTAKKVGQIVVLQELRLGSGASLSCITKNVCEPEHPRLCLIRRNGEPEALRTTKCTNRSYSRRLARYAHPLGPRDATMRQPMRHVARSDFWHFPAFGRRLKDFEGVPLLEF
jgi:hypothetical protein